MSKMILYFDGRCTGNGTPAARAGYGYVIEDADGQELATGCGLAGEGEGITAPAAEWAALRAGLRAVIEQAPDGVTAVEVRGDNQAVIRQVTGAWGVNAAHLLPLYRDVMKLARQIQACGVTPSFRWIPREENKRADELSRQAFDEAGRGGPPGDPWYGGGGDPVAIPLPEPGGCTDWTPTT